MLGKFKEAVQKKGTRLQSQMAAVSGATSPTPAQSEKEKKKKARRRSRKKPSKSEQKRLSAEAARKKTRDANENSGSDGTEEASDDGVVVKTFDEAAPLLGHVANGKKDPKQSLARVLQSERPDLFAGANAGLSTDELKLLDEHLVKKGELPRGSSLTLGKVVEMDSKIQVGSGDDVEVVMLYSYGRFGAVYLAYKDGSSTQCFALKTSRRMYASTRMLHEIAILEHMYNAQWSKKQKVSLPTHVTPMFFHGTAGGTPYLMMPMLDASLEKIRNEIGGRLPWCDAFYIGQESLVGIRECHAHWIVHRDVKPTNLLLSMQNNKSWWLCDFGDACTIGAKRILSPPDAPTLPFLSMIAHQAVTDLVPGSVRMDLESWFYMLLDLFVALPWASLTEEAETLNAKRDFWSTLDVFFQSNSAKVPPHLHSLAQIVVGALDETVYTRLTAVLRDGFNKYNETPPWRPSWIEMRPKRAELPPPTPNQRVKDKKRKILPWRRNKKKK